MNFVRLAPLAVIMLAAGTGCSQGSTDDTKSSGGSPGTGGSSAGQAAGAVGGAGGSSGSATTGGTGGTATGGAGAATTGGSAGMSAGATGGMATGGSGGMGAGAGGTGAGAGGTGAGGMAAGGMSGSGGIDADAFFSPGLNGLYFELRTMNEMDPGGSMYLLSDSGMACPTGADWASSGVTRTKDFVAKGTAGQSYTVAFQLRGIMAMRCISGGTPSGMMADAAGTKNDSFYVGGTQFMDSPLNTVQFDVKPAVTGAMANTYFLNGIPSSSNQCDTKISYDVGYAASFVVNGDSTVTLSTHSSDCTIPQNCGADPTGAAGCAPRKVDMTGVEVHASPYQPVEDFAGDSMFYPQWVVIDITSITQN